MKIVIDTDVDDLEDVVQLLSKVDDDFLTRWEPAEFVGFVVDVLNEYVAVRGGDVEDLLELVRERVAESAKP